MYTKSKLKDKILQKRNISKVTSRERPKWAPYLRLKNSKRTSKCQVFSSTVPAFFLFFSKSFGVSGKSHSAEKCKEGAFGSFRTTILLQNRKKIERGPFGDIEKKLQKSHKTEISKKN